MSIRRPTLAVALALAAGLVALGAPARAQDVLTTGSVARAPAASAPSSPLAVAPAAAPFAPLSLGPKPLSPEAQQKVSCRPFDEKGVATRIMSTNDICPQYAFFREDCQRDVKGGSANIALYAGHCLDRGDFLKFRY